MRTLKEIERAVSMCLQVNTILIEKDERNEIRLKNLENKIEKQKKKIRKLEKQLKKVSVSEPDIEPSKQE